MLDSTTIGVVGDSGIGSIVDDDPADSDPSEFGPAATPVGSPASGSVLVPCSQAATHLTLTVSSRLDPACTWTPRCRHFDLGRHARLPGRLENRARSHLQRFGHPHQAGDSATALSGITVRNCNVEEVPGEPQCHEERVQGPRGRGVNT